MTSSDDDSPVRQQFWTRLHSEWLPAYCNDPKRRYKIEGFTRGATAVSEVDARDFLRAIDHKIVTFDDGGRFRMPQSKACEVIFWEHSNEITPRPITVWFEPIITIAAVARLHLDYGWPVDCLGMQSADFAFDVTAYRPGDLQNEFIAGEVKATTKQLDTLLANLNSCCAESDHDQCLTSSMRKNAHKKWLGLGRCLAPLFWAIGPGGDSRVFTVSYSGDRPVGFIRGDETDLRFDLA